MDYSGRSRELRESLAENRLDALLVSHLPNVRYLCGFTGSAGAIVVTPKAAVFFTDGRYTAQAREEVYGSRIKVDKNAPVIAAAHWLSRNSAKLRRKGPIRIGIEGNYFTVSSREALAKSLSWNFRISVAPPLVERLRAVKDAEEIQALRAAAELGGKLFDRALEIIRPGVREIEVAAEMEYLARTSGAQEMSFPTIIASGPRSALPHGRASPAPIPASGFVVCDFGVILSGYCSDVTRSVYVGTPKPAARHTYKAVRRAQSAALEAVRPGVAVSAVDHAARRVLKSERLAQYFSHSTGHGLGLEIHEAPRIAAKQTDVLHAGMVITIEPGVYIPGEWGVRIEDTVLVTENGSEVLTSTSKKLITL